MTASGLIREIERAIKGAEPDRIVAVAVATALREMSRETANEIGPDLVGADDFRAMADDIERERIPLPESKPQGAPRGIEWERDEDHDGEWIAVKKKTARRRYGKVWAIGPNEWMASGFFSTFPTKEAAQAAVEARLRGEK